MTKKYYDALDEILDRPISFNPSFKKITGSTNAALLLSQAFYWSKRTSDPEGWFYKTREEWMEETALTESELDGAREKCRDRGVMEEKLKGVPATIHYRVKKAKVYELLGVQIPGFPESSFPGNSQIPEKPESGTSGNFNKESETTAKITTEQLELLKRAGLDWMIAAGMEITQEMIDTTIREQAALAEFEKAFGFGTLPWSGKGTWETFRKFVIKLYSENLNAFNEYVDWRKNDGKYTAYSNRKIRENPQQFIDTGWPEFCASKTLSSPTPTRPEYRNIVQELDEKFKNAVPNPFSKPRSLPRTNTLPGGSGNGAGQ